jgi:ketosteroid isomerase-like protein
MTPTETSNLATVRAYLDALASGAAGNALARFFTADALQIELPNKLNPQGGRSDLPTLLARAEQGRKLMQRQSYEIRSELAHGERVAIEARWSGVLAVPLGTLAAGATLSAHFAMFFELVDGRIAVQRNYDCFEPW